jgi:hypothetical protein
MPKTNGETNEEETLLREYLDGRRRRRHCDLQVYDAIAE